MASHSLDHLSSSDESDDILDVSLDQLRPARTQRAQAISAESDPISADFKPPVYPKSADEQRRLADILKKSFLFANLDSDDLDTVVAAVEKTEVPAQHCLIEQGEDGDCLYVVETGELDVLKSIDGAPATKVNVMGPGSTVGELALLYCSPRAASVIANQPCLVWKLDRDTFNCIVKTAAINKRKRVMSILTSIPLLATCDYNQLVQLADASATFEFPAGHAIVSQGEPGDAFYILLKGSADVMKNGACVLQYREGDYFGELALLNEQPRAASVITTAPTKIIRFDVASFHRVLLPLQATLKQRAQLYTDDPIY